NELFDFGGFGCDAEDRIELLRIGAERGARKLGLDLDGCRVVVIGDTPLDVAAALAIGAECIGVGTGGVEPAELAPAGATRGFGCLADSGAMGALMGTFQYRLTSGPRFARPSTDIGSALRATLKSSYSCTTTRVPG